MTSALLDGRFDEVEALAEEFRSLATEALSASTPDDEVRGIQLGRLALDRGQPEQAGAVLRAALDSGSASAVLSPMLTSVHAELGELNIAARELERHTADDFRVLGRNLPAGLAYLAEVAAALADGEHAARIYDRFRPYAGQMVATAAVALCPGAVDRYLGQLAATMGRFDAAEAHYEEALRMEEGMRAPPLLARTRYWYAGMLVEREGQSDKVGARQLLEQSLQTADRLGMAGLARQAAELLERL